MKHVCFFSRLAGGCKTGVPNSHQGTQGTKTFSPMQQKNLKVCMKQPGLVGRNFLIKAYIYPIYAVDFMALVPSPAPFCRAVEQPPQTAFFFFDFVLPQISATISPGIVHKPCPKVWKGSCRNKVLLSARNPMVSFHYMPLVVRLGKILSGESMDSAGNQGKSSTAEVSLSCPSDQNQPCEVEDLTQDVLFVNASHATLCAYKTSAGSASVCQCPGRKALYKRQGE